jgi:sugar/nucleoside kinase (ribokinase family)
MDDPKMRAVFWSCLPHLDTFMCNAYEGVRITKESDPKIAACVFRSGGARTVIIKLGEKGCWVESDSFTGLVPAPAVEVIDTTGAGDAFTAGYIAGILGGAKLEEACLNGNQAGARIVQKLGAVAAWIESG